MKAIIHSTIAAICMLIGIACAEPTFTREQASKLARVILDAPQHKNYKEIYDPEKLIYDSNIELWVFSRHFPITGGEAHVFELREKDGFYRLGIISTRAFSKSSPKFCIAPNLKKPIKDLLKEFAANPKNKG